uniref:Uncharacterized protein n=1 Tax=Meloidogyne enterolobii TaxID=390850 RepID=A0A6V7V1M9_MELEN|nr:unnamed protein product [Meloidogyne enterolobii]
MYSKYIKLKIQFMLKIIGYKFLSPNKINSIISLFYNSIICFCGHNFIFFYLTLIFYLAYLVNSNINTLIFK